MSHIGLKKVYILIIVAVALAASLVLTTYVLAFQNIPLTKVTFTPSYRAMTLSWNSYESTGTTSTTIYAVYRADDTTGKNAHRIAILDSTTKIYKDIYLIPGASYSYAVVCGQGVNGVDSVDTSTLAWSALQTVPLVGVTDLLGNVQPSPHVGADTTGAARNQKGCNKCHVSHDAAASTKYLIATDQSAAEPNASIALCESCHLSNSASEKSVMQTALTQTSGHTIKNAQNTSGILECSTCHGVHQDSKGAKGALLPSTIKKFGTLTSDISVDTSAKNAQCVACHDDKKTWYTATHTDEYPSLSSPLKLSGQSSSTGFNGFPLKGTFPGETVANSLTKNAHATIAASGTYDQGDCRYCHSSHAYGALGQLNTDRGELRAMKATDGVVSDQEKTSGAYASFCLSCHNSSNSGTPWASAKDVSSSFMVLPGSTDASRTAFINSNAGHRVISESGDLPAGSALPCYACHNPHGSSTNELNLSDELGINLKDDNDLCFTCHVSSDGNVCEDGNAGTVVPIANAQRQTVYGIMRTTGKLQLTTIDGHQSASTTKCVDCHGSAHNPVMPNAG